MSTRKKKKYKPEEPRQEKIRTRFLLEKYSESPVAEYDAWYNQNDLKLPVEIKATELHYQEHSTSRNVNLNHTDNVWPYAHWLFAYFTTEEDFEVFYASPEVMKKFILKLREELMEMKEIAEEMKGGLSEKTKTSKKRRKYARRILTRGVTLNDPKVKRSYLLANGAVVVNNREELNEQIARFIQRNPTFHTDYWKACEQPNRFESIFAGKGSKLPPRRNLTRQRSQQAA